MLDAGRRSPRSWSAWRFPVRRVQRHSRSTGCAWTTAPMSSLGVDDPTPVLGWKVAGSGPRPPDRVPGPRRRTPRRSFRPVPVGLRVAWTRASRASSTPAPRCARARGSRGRSASGTASGDASAWSAPVDVRDGPARRRPTGAGRSGSSSRRRPSTRRSRSTSARRTRATCGWTSPSSACRVTEGVARRSCRACSSPSWQLLDSHRGRRNLAPRARRVSASNPFQCRGWGTRAAHRRRADHARLHQPRIQDAGRHPVVLGPARPRRGPPLRPARALPAHRPADGRRQSRTSRSTSRVQASATSPTPRPRSRPSPTSRTRPAPTTQTALPIFARAFTAAKPVAERPPLRHRPRRTTRRRSTASRSPTHVLNPGITNPLRSVEYGTYDVTSLVRGGRQHARRRARQRHDERLPAGQRRRPGAPSSTRSSTASGRRPARCRRRSPRAPRTSRSARSPATPWATTSTSTPATARRWSRARSPRSAPRRDGTASPLPRRWPRPRARRVRARLRPGDAAGDRGHAAADRAARAHLRRRHARTTIVSDPTWRTARGPTVTDNWYAGTDYDARPSSRGWNEPGADLSAAERRKAAHGLDASRIAPPPTCRPSSCGARRRRCACRRRSTPGRDQAVREPARGRSTSARTSPASRA